MTIDEMACCWIVISQNDHGQNDKLPNYLLTKWQASESSLDKMTTEEMTRNWASLVILQFVCRFCISEETLKLKGKALSFLFCWQWKAATRFEIIFKIILRSSLQQEYHNWKSLVKIVWSRHGRDWKFGPRCSVHVSFSSGLIFSILFMYRSILVWFSPFKVGKITRAEQL